MKLCSLQNFQDKILMIWLSIPTLNICERLIYSQNLSVYFVAAKYCICGPILGIYKSLTCRYMNVEIGSETAQFPEKEYINGIFVAVCHANTAIGHSWQTMHWPVLYVYGVTKEFSRGKGMEEGGIQPGFSSVYESKHPSPNREKGQRMMWQNFLFIIIVYYRICGYLREF